MDAPWILDRLAFRRVGRELPVRAAVLSDAPLLGRLIAESARGLAGGDYTSAQIEASIGTSWAVDTQLIEDGTYFVVETDQRVIRGCGGWSRRRTLFGGDLQTGRDSSLLDPALDAARIRAFFVASVLGSSRHCSRLARPLRTEARRHGFRAADSWRPFRASASTAHLGTSSPRACSIR